VVSEYYIGPVKEMTGGRIDIMIEDIADRPRKDKEFRRILIENKIYAGDQQNQLIRYRNFDPKARLFYLTLSKSLPSNMDANAVDQINCECISYDQHILQWLIDCRKEAACLPGLREMLSQYIALIEELTNQSISKKMNKELIEEILKTPENLAAFYAIRASEWAIQAELIARLDTDLNDLLEHSKLNELKKDGPLLDMHVKEGGFSFGNGFLTENNLKIRFEFENSGYNNFAFGFTRIDHTKPCPIKDQIALAFSEVFAAQVGTDWWPAWSYFEDSYRYWRHEAFEDILSGKLAANIGDKLEKLSAIAKRVSEGLV
jgi:hypothetical protein